MGVFVVAVPERPFDRAEKHVDSQNPSRVADTLSSHQMAESWFDVADVVFHAAQLIRLAAKKMRQRRYCACREILSHCRRPIATEYSDVCDPAPLSILLFAIRIQTVILVTTALDLKGFLHSSFLNPYDTKFAAPAKVRPTADCIVLRPSIRPADSCFVSYAAVGFGIQLNFERFSFEKVPLGCLLVLGQSFYDAVVPPARLLFPCFGPHRK